MYSKCVSAIFGGHLKYLHKTQKHTYLRNGVRWIDFDKLFLTNYLAIYPKIVLPLLLAAILNLCILHKNEIIMETANILKTISPE